MQVGLNYPFFQANNTWLRVDLLFDINQVPLWGQYCGRLLVAALYDGSTSPWAPQVTQLAPQVNVACWDGAISVLNPNPAANEIEATDVAVAFLSEIGGIEFWSSMWYDG
jgi:hypothetical protein